MNRLIFSLGMMAAVALSSCTSQIKNETQANDPDAMSAENHATAPKEDNTSKGDCEVCGFWVGYFERDDDDYSKTLVVDEGYVWNKENKINISIDRIEGDQVVGHSVVAGNDRPFKGTVKTENGAMVFEVAEPGDDKYDGKFSFSIADGTLTGKWKAYKKINIQKRKYELKPAVYKYDPNIMLVPSKAFVDWEKAHKTDESELPEGEEEFISNYFVSATDKIYEINASNTLLTKADVENLRKGDLLIIRNAIYARHGYSFKKRPLRVFFDAQPWYIPVHTDIKSELTDTEKKNIELIMRFEQHAEEYYDSFGRG